MTQVQAHAATRVIGTRTPVRYGQVGTAAALILFPLLSIFIFASHPNLGSLQPVHDIEMWIAEWHGNTALHFAHVLMLLCVPLLIAITSELMRMLLNRGHMYGLIGGTLTVIGAAFLAADKGALCLVTSAFDTLSPPEFAQIYPAIEVIRGMQGWLWIVYGFALVPIGFVILGIGLYRTRTIPRWQAGTLILGAVLMLNPDIEIISVAASAVLAFALVPLGVRRLQEALTV